MLQNGATEQFVNSWRRAFSLRPTALHYAYELCYTLGVPLQSIYTYLFLLSQEQTFLRCYYSSSILKSSPLRYILLLYVSLFHPCADWLIAFLFIACIYYWNASQWALSSEDRRLCLSMAIPASPSLCGMDWVHVCAISGGKRRAVLHVSTRDGDTWGEGHVIIRLNIN